MRELTVDLFVTVDGWATVRDSSDYFSGDGSTDLERWIDEQMEHPEVLLMGANTYQVLSAPQGAGRLQRRMAEVEKVVFSTTLAGPLEWDNTSLEAGPLEDTVRALKAQEGGPLRVLGSPTLAHDLLAGGMADRVRLVVFPQVLGATGENRVLDADLHAFDLALENQRVLDDTLVLLEYRVTTTS